MFFNRSTDYSDIPLRPAIIVDDTIWVGETYKRRENNRVKAIEVVLFILPFGDDRETPNLDQSKKLEGIDHLFELILFGNNHVLAVGNFQKAGQVGPRLVGILIHKDTKEVVEQICLIDGSLCNTFNPVSIVASGDRVAAAIWDKGVVLAGARTRREILAMSSTA